MALGTVGGTLLTLPVDPVKLLVLTAFVDGLIAATFLVLVMLVSGDRQIMGEHRNGRLAATLGWAATVLMAGAAALALLG